MDRREREALDRHLTTEPEWRTEEPTEREEVSVMKLKLTTSRIIELEESSSRPRTIPEHVATMFGQHPITRIDIVHAAGLMTEGEEVTESYELA